VKYGQVNKGSVDGRSEPDRVAGEGGKGRGRHVRWRRGQDRAVKRMEYGWGGGEGVNGDAMLVKDLKDSSSVQA
jgi:hypothetical protein